MQSTVEALEGNKIRINVNIDDVEFERNVEEAFRKLARQVRVPGFRPGKAPRRVLEAQLGDEGRRAARAQAIEDAVPMYLTQAVREHRIDLIATPKVDHVHGEEEGSVSFHAECEVRPTVTVPGYAGLQVELPSLTVGDAEIDEAVTTERKRHGTLVDVDRAIAAGDQVTLDLAGVRDGAPVPGLNVEGWLYEVGRGWVSKEFDAKITGAKLDDTLTFSDVPNGDEKPADFTVTVRKVQELKLADLTDQWVSDTFGEFDTVDQWRASLAERFASMKLNQVRSVVIDRVTDELAKLVDIELPEAMVEGDLNSRARGTIEQFQRQGIALEQFLQITGQTMDQFVEQLRDQSRKAVRVDLALRAVAAGESFEADDADVDVELERIAVRSNVKVNRVRKLYQRNDAIDDLKAQIRKSKALDWLLHNVKYVDPDGTVIAKDKVLGERGIDIDSSVDTGATGQSATSQEPNGTVGDEPDDA
jgi:trigger factor